jgi:UDP-N-acetylglucosamine transferase subunit ALG13
VIFVTVGNATQGFGRLLNAVDRMAGEGAFGKEIVFIQSGNNPGFRTSHCKHEPFLDMANFETKIQEADLVISHAGAGTLFHVFQAGKLSVVMPRRKKYGEHVDDHQIELVEALAAEGRIIPAYEPEDLPNAIEKAFAENRRRKGSGVRSEEKKSPMLELVAKAIENLMSK